MPSSTRARLYWSLRESLVVAGIFLAWALAYVALRVLLVLPMFLVQVVGPPRVLGEAVQTLYRGSETVLVPVVTQGAMATVALYVLVRAGTRIVDHYRGEPVFA